MSDLPGSKPTPNPASEAAANRVEDDAERWRSNLRTVFGAVLLALVIRITLFEAFEIDGPSMEPTLLHEDRVVVAKCLYGLFLPRMRHAILNWGTPNLGDVVIVNSPMDDIDIVKRVVGLPGDVIERRGHQVYRNGEPIPTREVGPCESSQEKELDPECYLYEERLGDHVYRTSHGRNSLRPDVGPIEIEPGYIFVMGDHRDRSNDSTNPQVGPIPIRRVKGRALFLYLSGSALRGAVRWDRIGKSVD
jgi:signal peptidase I